MTVPGLIIQGGHDCQISPDNGERLIRTAPDNKYAEIATMNHVLKAVPADCAAAIGSYNNPALPLHPELVPAVTRFLSARCRYVSGCIPSGYFFQCLQEVIINLGEIIFKAGEFRETLNIQGNMHHKTVDQTA